MSHFKNNTQKRETEVEKLQNFVHLKLVDFDTKIPQKNLKENLWKS